jgi:hypothetical protein
MLRVRQLESENEDLRRDKGELLFFQDTLVKKNKRLEKINATRDKILLTAVFVDFIALGLTIWGAESLKDSKALNPAMIVFGCISLGLSIYGCYEPRLNKGEKEEQVKEVELQELDEEKGLGAFN